jgi:hypothetical protein
MRSISHVAATIIQVTVCVPVLALALVSGISGPIPAQERPARTASSDHATPAPSDTVELFGPGVFSTGDFELTPTFTPNSDTAFFSVSTPVYGRMRFILETHRTGDGWSEPRVAPFSGAYDDVDPFVTVDGRNLFFLSRRPVTGTTPQRDLNIWVMERRGNGWGPPRHLGSRVNGSGPVHYVTATARGTLYISAVRPDSRGSGDIYRVRYVNGEYQEPESLGPTVNSAEDHDTTPYVAPDESFVIFGSRGRADSFGDIDLYVSFRDASGQWSSPRNLGAGVNSPRTDYCPIVSPDGKWLYFASTRHSLPDSAFSPAVDAPALRRLLRGPGNMLGDTYRIRLAPLLEKARSMP